MTRITERQLEKAKERAYANGWNDGLKAGGQIGVDEWSVAPSLPCTFHGCGRPRDDSAHVKDNERRQSGQHVWRHE